MKQLFTAIAIIVAISVQAQKPKTIKINPSALKCEDGLWRGTLAFDTTTNTLRPLLWVQDSVVDSATLKTLMLPLTYDPVNDSTVTLDSSIISGSFAIGYTDVLYHNTLWVDNKDSVWLEGDTMAIVRMLAKRIKQRDSDLFASYDFAAKKQKLIDASIDFTNHVPEYWKDKKNNPAWPKYAALLRKNGYIMTKKKK